MLIGADIVGLVAVPERSAIVLAFEDNIARGLWLVWRDGSVTRVGDPNNEYGGRPWLLAMQRAGVSRVAVWAEDVPDYMLTAFTLQPPESVFEAKRRIHQDHARVCRKVAGVLGWITYGLFGLARARRLRA